MPHSSSPKTDDFLLKAPCPFISFLEISSFSCSLPPPLEPVLLHWPLLSAPQTPVSFYSVPLPTWLPHYFAEITDTPNSHSLEWNQKPFIMWISHLWQRALLSLLTWIQPSDLAATRGLHMWVIRLQEWLTKFLLFSGVHGADAPLKAFALGCSSGWNTLSGVFSWTHFFSLLRCQLR